jgi:hypothetical protein
MGFNFHGAEKNPETIRVNGALIRGYFFVTK